MSVPLYQEENTLALIRAALNEQTLSTAWDEGAKLGFNEAVALALGKAGDGDADIQLS